MFPASLMARHGNAGCLSRQIVGQTARRLGYDLERPCRGEEMKPRLPECIEGQTSGKPARQKNAIADIE